MLGEYPLDLALGKSSSGLDLADTLEGVGSRVLDYLLFALDHRLVIRLVMAGGPVGTVGIRRAVQIDVADGMSVVIYHPGTFPIFSKV